MAKCLIFCAGGFHGLLEPVRQDDYLIAADGGLRHLETLGLRPHSILGDFDSLGHVPEGATVFPVEKDDTDAMLAARRGLSLGCREFLFYGSLDGPRLDHTVANFQTLAFLADHGAMGFLTGEHQTAAVIRSGELHFPSTTPGTLSVFCLG
ncbi:MAG: thiamine diphosphokinase, partial [Oscillospiraceae bacterium]|nr:thiamine diphosphokinase [Oscillospiraceae bacterium]